MKNSVASVASRQPSSTQRELTMHDGNPAHGLRESYQELMQIRDPRELHDKIVELLRPYEGSGMSRSNFERAKIALKQSMVRRDPLVALQSYVTNFMLKADGLGVLGLEYR